MATTDKDPTDDLTKELQQLLEAITGESHNEKEFAENVDKAIQTLLTLRHLKKGGKQQSSSSIELHNRIVSVKPRDINYPLVTFDRSSIQKWLKEGDKASIHGVVSPSPDRPPLFPSLFKALSSSDLYEQKEAARSLHSLTKRIPLTETETKEFIPRLLTPLTGTKIDPDLHRYLIATLMNLSIHEHNKKFVAETPMAVQILLSALRSETVKTKRDAAAALSLLSSLDANKSLIGKAGGLMPLIDVLEEGHPSVMKDAASAIHNLLFDDEIKGRAVENGAVRVVLKKIKERVHVDELLGILAVLSDHHKAVAEMADLGAVSCLFSVMKETDCEQNTEKCIMMIHRICLKDESKWEEMREEEGRYETILKIAETGSLMAKRRANMILDLIGIVRPHTGRA